jgi:hypothetical protein
MLEIKGKGDMKTYFVTNKLDDDGNSIQCQYQDVYEEYNNKEIAAGRKVIELHSSQIENTNRNLGMGFREMGLETDAINDTVHDENTSREKFKKKGTKNIDETVKITQMECSYEESKISENCKDIQSILEEDKNKLSRASKFKILTNKHIILPNKRATSVLDIPTLSNTNKVTFSKQNIIIPKKTSSTCSLI